MAVNIPSCPLAFAEMFHEAGFHCLVEIIPLGFSQNRASKGIDVFFLLC